MFYNDLFPKNMTELQVRLTFRAPPPPPPPYQAVIRLNVYLTHVSCLGGLLLTFIVILLFDRRLTNMFCSNDQVLVSFRYRISVDISVNLLRCAQHYAECIKQPCLTYS